MEEGKETKKSGREGEDGRDRLSELHDDVLLHIILFINTNTAVRISLLSKRWNNLWKCLTNLCFRRRSFKNITNYNKFVSHVFSHRDTSIPLHCLDFEACGIIAHQLLDTVTPYLQCVTQLRIYLDQESRDMFYYSIPFIFSSPSLTSLTLSILCPRNILNLPQSLHLPALKTLNLTNVSFSARPNDVCAEPFSNCFSLNSLVLVGCSLSDHTKVLSISNSNLSRFTMKRYDEQQYKIVLSTPNLTHFAIRSYIGCHDLSSLSDLTLLEDVNIEISTIFHATVLRLLRMLSYVKILTLSKAVIEAILRVSYSSVFSS
ncbi:hypothetical protein PHAVU_004G118400 [Phaseolus vulgaris]|uniref:Uncharacterized protein n=1 Tax=Phaseolus vulgaris TaxID=3885 RepID=V7C2B6_PHAVU|nr:hypothetical protein PHAVU_004G118400g [Phaseolus vulgaris]ESW24297.1 hypothetical protein PHAVU_004G118400g [Phaseolus vulgaris]